MQEQINQILRENANDPNKAKSEIQKLTKRNFTLYEDSGSLFIEFDDPTDSIDFGGFTLLKG